MISAKLFLILIIAIILVTLTLLFIVVYYSVYTSVPSHLHATFTTQNGPVTEFVYNSYLQTNLQLDSLLLMANYDYDPNVSWSLWRLVRLTSYLSGKRPKKIALPEYDAPEDIMGLNQNGRPIKTGMLYHNPISQTTVMAFHGTSNAADWRTDMELQQIQNSLNSDSKNKEKVHKGFLKRYTFMQPDIKKLINKYNESTREGGWFVAGHSLGGAVATLVAYDQKDNFSSLPHIYTFGQPRVGNSEFAKKMDSMYPSGAYRVVNTSDVITLLPPPVWFQKIYEHAFSEQRFTLNLIEYSKNHIEAYQKFLDPTKI